MQLALRAPVFGSSGYAVAARGLLQALLDTPLNIHLQPLQWLNGFEIFESRELYLRFKSLTQTPVQPEHTPLLHWSIASEFTGRGKFARAIGHTVFETDQLISSFVEGANRMDALIVPSEFNRQTFQKSGVKVPMHLVHQGVDTEVFTPLGERLNLPQRFTFLCVSQISYRKGIDLVLKAFLELFAQRPDVQLVMRSYFRDGSDQDAAEVKEFVRLFREQEMKGLKTGNIFLLRNLTSAQMPALYRSADVLLAPFRGEGWGLPLTEAMACELPVIATNWGGATEFLTPQVATLLNHQLLPIPDDIPPVFMGKHLTAAQQSGHHLAEPDYEQFKHAMWDAYQNYFHYKTKALAAREHMLTHFTWQKAAAQLLDALKKEGFS